LVMISSCQLVVKLVFIAQMTRKRIVLLAY
jgi:hypothetical protein